MTERKKFVLFLVIFVAVWFMPLESDRFSGAIFEALALLRWYAREHVILCLVPAFFIAGAIVNFVSQNSVMKYLGSQARRSVAYGVAACSGSILAVCSCTVLPLFAGIYMRGAGLGPATAFLYSGPAINALAIILTARVLGAEIGIARAAGAVLFSIIIGLLMALIFRKDEAAKQAAMPVLPPDESTRSLKQNIFYFALMLIFLVFANWGKPQDGDSSSIWNLVYSAKWLISGASVVLLFIVVLRWFSRGEIRSWASSSWEYAAMTLPLLFGGVFVAGFLLGRPGHEGIIPSEWVAVLLGGNSLGANLFASVVGAFMYFATLTEIPIVQGLIGAGMGKGPALALLLAGPALSLPSMLVIRSVIGTKKTVVYVCLVVVMATLSGLIFGTFF